MVGAKSTRGKVMDLPVVVTKSKDGIVVIHLFDKVFPL